MTYAELIEEVRQLLPKNKNTGKPIVTELAEVVGKPRELIWNWIVPMRSVANGESTLRMLEWVEKKKSEKILLSKVECDTVTTEPESDEPQQQSQTQ